MKLTPDQRSMIRRQYAAGMVLTQLGKLYGVSHQTIANIVGKCSTREQDEAWGRDAGRRIGFMGLPVTR